MSVITEQPQNNSLVSGKEERAPGNAVGSRSAEAGAQAIFQAFQNYQARFQEITRRARQRFEERDWHGAQSDAVERLDLYGEVIGRIVSDIRGLLGDEIWEKATWGEMRRVYSGLIAGRDDLELAETFFNSVTRRIFSTVGVDPEIEYVASDFDALASPVSMPACRWFPPGETTISMVQEILETFSFGPGYADLERDTSLAAAQIDAALQGVGGAGVVQMVEFYPSVFYRLKGAYLIGRIRLLDRFLPLVFCLRNDQGGVRVDAVLLDEDETSILFSFTRSYFHVEVDRPSDLVSFLKSVIPLKRIAELYISIGYNKHGKTELYRSLLRHLTCTEDKFVSARGEKGMVMLVFTMPSYDIVFKVIRDRFAEPKNTSRREVMERYGLVFHRDRAGRLVDAQEFEHLRFERCCFEESCLQELLEGAPSSVQVEGDWVSIRHLYAERKLTPLDIFLREASPEAAQEAVVDYGNAIKDLAATNIFPGDILLKNFGVTRHGRVVFYDYDELCLLVDCRFRKMPQAREYTDEFQSEPWFYVGKSDIFPEEFRTFLGLKPPLRETFIRHHEDLFGVEYWKKMQARHKAGEVVDILPYKASRRLVSDESVVD